MTNFSDLYDVKLPYGLEMRAILVGSALFTAGFLFRGIFSHSTRGGIIESPRKTLLPKLSRQEISDLPYPPDALPGARDLDTPFGSVRVYEWGPEDGRKVLLVHGISTPCLALGSVAHALADKGCRVMLFDLPGRGFSDTPIDIEQDVRLFTSYMLMVLASSTLAWTGQASGGFSLIGYSLGGGISAAFTSYYPNLVNSLILIAPSGLIRDYHISRVSRVIYSTGILPEPLLHSIVRRRLQKPLYPPKQPNQVESTAGAETAVKAEVNIEGNQNVVLSKSHPDITIESAVNHQVVNHEGFVHAFMSSIRHGPVQNQHGRWRRIGQRLSDKNKTSTKNEKVFVILGERDPIIVVDEIQEDARNVLDGNVVFSTLPAGHEAPVTKGQEVADLIWNFWHD